MRTEIWLNDAWQFARLDAPVHAGTCPEPAHWETVDLPHTARIEQPHVRFPWQGVCAYRRNIEAPPGGPGRRVRLEFGAAMQIAEVWVDGELRLRHLGGYLPFSIDLTEDLARTGSCSLGIALDNRDTDLCPPGKPTRELDFIYPGGLYRGARLIATHPVHISDPHVAGIEAGGGVFVQCHDVSGQRAAVAIRTHVANESGAVARRCAVRAQVFAPDGALVADATAIPLMIAAAGAHTFAQTIAVDSPALWSPHTPALYLLRTTVFCDGEPVDAVDTRFGIRRIEIGRRLYVNGEEISLIGTNRHQEYPCIGYALSRRAARRDAVKIKEGGYNLVRLSHYPQDPAFLDACDELGIFVQAAIPGWQQFHANPSFVARSFQDIRELIRRDRNHPCVLFWEPNLNETDGDHADWRRAAFEIAHAEYPGDQCFTFGDAYPKNEGWDWEAAAFVREYGDWNFGGNQSTSRRTRADGEEGMLQQAWNFQWALNHLRARRSDPNVDFYGAAAWCMFDYNRGYHETQCTCGAMDLFRLPKYVYDLFRSQRDPRVSLPGVDSGPMAAIANNWTPRSAPCKVVVYSNCDEVELILNGRPIARQSPDSGLDTPYSPAEDGAGATVTVGAEFDVSGGRPFDGGNCRNLDHPPFTFAGAPYEPGELVAVGFLGGVEVARHTVRTPGRPRALALRADIAGVPLSADGADAVFVYAQAVDAAGTLCPHFSGPVRFAVAGAGALVGESVVCATGGIAPALVRAARMAGAVTVRAGAEGLDSDEIVIQSGVGE